MAKLTKMFSWQKFLVIQYDIENTVTLRLLNVAMVHIRMKVHTTTHIHVRKSNHKLNQCDWLSVAPHTQGTRAPAPLSIHIPIVVLEGHGQVCLHSWIMD